jgi:hypothetical protein
VHSGSDFCLLDREHGIRHGERVTEEPKIAEFRNALR